VMFGISASAGFIFKDNIVAYNGNGMNCQVAPNTLATCWPSGTFLNNVVVDNSAAGFNGSTWGSGSIITPIKTAFTQVGFTSAATANYTLLNTSVGFHAASDGADVGYNHSTLVSALGFDPSGATVSPGRRLSGKMFLRGVTVR